MKHAYHQGKGDTAQQTPEAIRVPWLSLTGIRHDEQKGQDV